MSGKWSKEAQEKKKNILGTKQQVWNSSNALSDCPLKNRRTAEPLYNEMWVSGMFCFCRGIKYMGQCRHSAAVVESGGRIWRWLWMSAEIVARCQIYCYCEWWRILWIFATLSSICSVKQSKIIIAYGTDYDYIMSNCRVRTDWELRGDGLANTDWMLGTYSHLPHG